LEKSDHAKDMYQALEEMGTHAFRHGKVLMVISNFAYVGEQFTIFNAMAWYDGNIVELDLPLHFVGFEHDGIDPLSSAYDYLSNFIRFSAGT